ncbi:MAG: EamA family transporter [Spirosomataceae bacterium]|mgnify:CR=1 FL=1
MKKIGSGLLFAALWGSGSVATKLGIKDVQPLLLINIRFVIAALLMLIISLIVNKDRLPQKKEWRFLFMCGLLNMAIYPSAFVFAMKHVTAGIGTLASATCPLIISVLNAVFLSRKITTNIWVGLLVGLIGIAIAIYPLLLIAHATPFGILLLSFSMLCYSIGTVYYQSIEWALPKLAINGWQVLLGSVMLLPFTSIFYQSSENNFTPNFYYSVFWLAIPISIIAVQIWLYLLKAEPVKASFWLYLCPIFGFLFSAMLTQEPITLYTFVGTLFVIIGLYVGKMEKKKVS